MNTKKRFLSVLTAVLITAATFAASPAYAHSKSATTSFPNGVKLTANTWITSFSWNNCGNWTSSAVITAKPVWVKDAVSFHANGIGASLSGVSASGSGANASVSWTNSNGAKTSNLSGRVCVNWLTWYLSMTTTASAYYYGNVRVASAGV